MSICRNPQTRTSLLLALCLAPLAACGESSSVQAPLEVTVTLGSADGLVVSEPAGIACGTSCSALFPSGTQLKLSALASAGFELESWQGGCTGSDPVCSFTVSAATQVRATFRRAVPQRSLVITRSGSGSGVVTSDAFGLQCGATCTIRAPEGSTLTLRATPDAQSSFTGWTGGPCTGSAPTCQLRLDGDLAINAAFGKPATCGEILAAAPGAKDGEYKLFVGGDPQKPWDAFCAFGSTPPAVYLSLPKTTNANFSQYYAGGGRTGTNVRTQYQKVRIDPETLLVNESDKTYSLSVGSINDGSGGVITQMNYGSAADCFNTNSSRGTGNVDLTGTPFAVAPNAFVTSGYIAAGSASYSSDSRIVSLTGGGFCGGTEVRKGAKNPFNLQLLYVGP
ncbi:MAG: GON domain-containing protein [Polyangia bacterium]